jgi:hypothetical protein
VFKPRDSRVDLGLVSTSGRKGKPLELRFNKLGLLRALFLNPQRESHRDGTRKSWRLSWVCWLNVAKRSLFHSVAEFLQNPEQANSSRQAPCLPRSVRYSLLLGKSPRWNLPANTVFSAALETRRDIARLSFIYSQHLHRHFHTVCVAFAFCVQVSSAYLSYHIGWTFHLRMTASDP